MSEKVARADVAQLRQTTQFTCCATSITSALHALGKPFTEDDVNKVLGAAPMAGATWEAMLATVQYFGCRGTLVVPATPRMLKAWTDKGIPVVIAWNPEGRPWSHASTVFDVKEDADGKLTVYIMDSNIPNPDETTRVMDADTFCQKWGEKVSDTLIVRRPAMAIEREVSVEGRQVVASTHPASTTFDWRALGKDLREALSRTPVPPRVVTGEVHPSAQFISIACQFGRDYFEKRGWDDDAVRGIIDDLASKHGLTESGNFYRTPDGWKVNIGIMASYFGGNPERLASSARRAMLPSGHPNKYYFTVLGEGKDNYRTVERALPAILQREGWTNVEVHDEDRNEHEDYRPPSQDTRNPDPRQRPRYYGSASRVAETYLSAKGMQDVKPDTRTPGMVTVKEKPRDLGRSEYGPGFVTDIMRHPGNGAHQNRDREVGTGRSRKPKHKQNWSDRESTNTDEDT